MKRIVTLIGAIVLSASVAASAQVVTADQLRQWFSNNDTYSQGFRAGYSQGVADSARAAYGNRNLLTQNVVLCAQRQPINNLVQMASDALQRWLNVNNPNVPAAVPVLTAYNSCVVPRHMEEIGPK
jgi:hypothetical protein